MRVAPVAERAAPQVFVPHVQAADESHPTIHYYDLAMIAEIELEAVASATPGVERRHGDAGGAQGLDIGFRQRVAADLIVQDPDR